MSTLQSHLKSIDAAGDNVESAEAARLKLVEALDRDPTASAAVAEALYRLGLTTLLHRKDVAAAMDLFKRAADKKDGAWSPLARTSYALTLHAKGKLQQAVFELRKVVQSGAAPTAASVTALIMLCLLLRDQGAKPSEIEKADKERINALTAFLGTTEPSSAERAHWQLMLALAHREGGSRTECKRLLESVQSMGTAAGANTLGQAKELLKGM